MKTHEMKIPNVLFGLAFCNLYLLTPLYYLFPQISSIIPSSIAAAIPYIFIVPIIILSIVIKKGRCPKSILALLLVAILMLFMAISGNAYMGNIVFSTSYFVQIVFSIFILIFFTTVDVYRYLRFAVVLIAAICIYGQFAGLYVNDTTNTVMKLSYMSLGYCLILMSMLMFEFGRLDENQKKKIMFTLAGVIVGLFACVFGNRGTLVIMLVYLILRCIKACNNKIPTKKQIVLVLTLFIAIILLIAYRDELFQMLIRLCERLGLESRTLSMILAGNLGKSDRSDVYSIALEVLKENPFAIRGPGAMLNYTNGRYNAHNFILEMCVEYGVIITSVIVALVGKCFYHSISMYLRDEEDDDQTKNRISFAFVLLLHAIIQLMFSSTAYVCNELWLGISATVALMSTQRKRLPQFMTTKILNRKGGAVK